MHKILPILLLTALLASCSGVRKASQTPDDVYYSPARSASSRTVGDRDVVKDEYTDADTEESPDDRYESVTASTDDNYLRMKVQDHYRWSTIDDYDYWYDSRYYYNSYACSPLYWNSWYGGGLGWGYGWGGLGWNSFYPGFGLGLSWYSSPMYYWNSWYSPYYTVVYYKNPVAYSRPSGSNVKAFANRRIINSNASYNSYNYNRSVRDNSGNFGSLVRRVFTPNNNNSNNNSNNNWLRPQRSFSNSVTPSSSAGGRSGGFSSSSGSSGARPSRR